MSTFENKDNPNNGEIFAHLIPGHMVPLDTTKPWVMSTVYGKWHLTSGGCRYSTIIEMWNREYRDTTPEESEMCFYCRRRWRQIQKDKPLAM